MADKNSKIVSGESPNLLPDRKFISWIADEESRRTPIKKAGNVPWYGIAALAGSGCTSLVALAILLGVHNRPVWPDTGIYNFMQPASWLSALVSINCVLLNIALTEGLTIAWWFKATRRTSRVVDLHETWSIGTSPLSALQSWRQFNYISLATIFVALLPLEGFLLQGAISTPLSTVSRNVTATIPMMKQLQQGYSGYISSRGGVGTYDSIWPYVWQQVQNQAGNKYAQYAYFGAYDVNNHSLNLIYDNDTSSTFTARVAGAGFNMTCTPYQLSYDLLPSAAEPTKAGLIFWSSFHWDLASPNNATLDVYWKEDTSCVGQYQARNCSLVAATVEYPVQVQLDVSQSYPGPYYSLQPATTRQDDRVLDILDIYPDEGVTNTTYGGIFQSFSNWFDSTMYAITWQNQSGFFNYSGVLVNAINPSYQTDSIAWNCNISFTYGLDNIGYFQAFNSPGTNPAVLEGISFYNNPIDVAEMVLGQIRQAMFLASVYSGSQWWNVYDYSTYYNAYLPGTQSDYLQNVTALRETATPIYKVRFYLWGSSLAVTYLVILPTFGGYWVLGRRPTMNPVDTARAFHPPILSHPEPQVDIGALLREVGSQNIHQQDHAPVPGPAAVVSAGEKSGGVATTVQEDNNNDESIW